jgi:ParB family chromosome partitioning protein
MEIVDIAVKDLVPYDKNPRRNDEAAVKVAESIKQFGFKIPLVVDRNNVVVCGHTRLKAAKKLKLKTVPCILADDLSEDQIKAFRLVDNRTAEIAEWDFALLEEELADVQLDMTAFDFDDLLAEEEAGSENSQTPVGAEREEESALPPPTEREQYVHAPNCHPGL